MTTLEKIRLFERYLELTQGNSDREVDVVLEKLLERKKIELKQHCDEMQTELSAFEKQYGISSKEFFEKFERGELGDEMDWFDWSATWQMYNNVLKYLKALSVEPAAA